MGMLECLVLEPKHCECEHIRNWVGGIEKKVMITSGYKLCRNGKKECIEGGFVLLVKGGIGAIILKTIRGPTISTELFWVTAPNCKNNSVMGICYCSLTTSPGYSWDGERDQEEFKLAELRTFLSKCECFGISAIFKLGIRHYTECEVVYAVVKVLETVPLVHCPVGRVGDAQLIVQLNYWHYITLSWTGYWHIIAQCFKSEVLNLF